MPPTKNCFCYTYAIYNNYNLNYKLFSLSLMDIIVKNLKISKDRNMLFYVIPENFEYIDVYYIN